MNIDQRDPTVNSAPILIGDATIDTPADVELVGSELTSKAISSGTISCALVSGDNATEGGTVGLPHALDANGDAHGNLFTTSTYMKIRSLILRLRKVGGPSGDMRVQLHSASGSDPSATVLATPPDRVISTAIGTSGGGHLVTFPLSTPYEASASTSYAITIRPQGATLDGANYFLWVTTNSNGCTDFPAYRESVDSGTSWGNGSNLGYRRSYFAVTADKHATSGSVSWIVTSAGGMVWIMSTFAFLENPNGLTGGTITYDVGAGSSSTTPSYSSTGLTLAQVRALADLTGAYFYVRAHLTVSAPAFDRAALGNGSISVR